MTMPATRLSQRIQYFFIWSFVEAHVTCLNNEWGYGVIFGPGEHPNTVQSAQPYYVSFSLANEERINFLASSALFPRSFHTLSTIISRLSHATNPTATRNVKFACHSIVLRSPRATGKIASRYTLQPIATCLHFILDQYRIRSSDPNVFTHVR